MGNSFTRNYSDGSVVSQLSLYEFVQTYVLDCFPCLDRSESEEVFSMC
jgi:hypothetical protein